MLWKKYKKICSKLKGEHSCRSVISIKMLCKFIEITLRRGCSPVNLLYIYRTPFYNGRLLLNHVFANVSKQKQSLIFLWINDLWLINIVQLSLWKYSFPSNKGLQMKLQKIITSSYCYLTLDKKSVFLQLFTD